MGILADGYNFELYFFSRKGIVHLHFDYPPGVSGVSSENQFQLSTKDVIVFEV